MFIAPPFVLNISLSCLLFQKNRKISNISTILEENGRYPNKHLQWNF